MSRRFVSAFAVLLSTTISAAPAAEGAKLAFPGQGRDDTSFNSFFGDRSVEPVPTAAALATLQRRRGPGVLVVTTHQVNITGLTGIVPASGEGVVVHPGRDGVEVLGRLQP